MQARILQTSVVVFEIDGRAVVRPAAYDTHGGRWLGLDGPVKTVLSCIWRWMASMVLREGK